ncbi:MAG: AEC family transporter [Pseudomonadota bacterium]
MGSIVAGLIPIAGAIILGWLIRRTGLIPADLWGGITRLSYVALLPALIFVTIARTDVVSLPAGGFLAAATIGFLAMAGIALALKPLLRTDDPTFTSVFQGAIRWNGFVILALAQAALTPQQAALTALVFVPTIPLINIMAVAALSVWGSRGGGVQFGPVLMRIVTNPLILGTVAGLVVSTLPYQLPSALFETADLIGRAALPLILLTVGAGLDFSAVKANPALLVVAISLKLVVAPLVFMLIGQTLGLSQETIVVLVAVGAAPGAASSYVLARELGGNAELTAGHVTMTTILAFISLPIWIAVAAG